MVYIIRGNLRHVRTKMESTTVGDYEHRKWGRVIRCALLESRLQAVSFLLGNMELRGVCPMTHVSGKPFRIPCLSGGGGRVSIGAIPAPLMYRCRSNLPHSQSPFLPSTPRMETEGPALSEGEFGEQQDHLPSEYRIERRTDMENTKKC